jgi:hypothetical protein
VAVLSPARINRFLTEGDAAANSYEKGQKFEELIKYVFGCIPGVEYYKSNIVISPKVRK